MLEKEFPKEPYCVFQLRRELELLDEEQFPRLNAVLSNLEEELEFADSEDLSFYQFCDYPPVLNIHSNYATSLEEYVRSLKSDCKYGLSVFDKIILTQLHILMEKDFAESIYDWSDIPSDYLVVIKECLLGKLLQIARINIDKGDLCRAAHRGSLHIIPFPDTSFDMVEEYDLTGVAFNEVVKSIPSDLL